MELSRPVVVEHHGHLTLTLDFQGQILKMLYLRNGRADWHGTKGMWIHRMLHPLCDFQLSLTHDLDLGFSRSNYISGMGWPIDMERKGCESIGCYTHFVTFNFPSPMTLTLDFQGQILKKSHLMNGMADWPGTKGMWVDRMLDPCCDFQCSPLPWPWPWILRSNFEKVVSEEWDSWLTWNEKDVSR